MKIKIGFETDSSRIEFVDTGVDPDDGDDFPAVEIGVGYNGEDYADGVFLTIPEFDKFVAELIKFNQSLQARYVGVQHEGR